MAKIGLKYPVYKGETTQGVIGKAIQADISIEVNDVKLYADDAIAESDKSFSGGTLTLGIDDLSDEVYATLLGHEVNPVTGEITAAGGDDGPYVGIGFYGAKKVGGVRKYRAIWLPKVQFAEPNDENATKGENVEFRTPSLEGTIMVDDNGDWKKENTFDTEDEAKAYLEEKAGITSVPASISSLTVSNGTLTPTFDAAEYTYSCACTDDITLTATFSGTARVYVDGAYIEALKSTVAGSEIAMVAGDNKIIKIVVQESGKTAVTYTIVAQM